MLYIPRGFAHGFQTLTDHCELLYHHSDYYSKEFERGIKFDDQSIGVEWPLAVTDLSERDTKHALLTPQFTGI